MRTAGQPGQIVPFAEIPRRLEGEVARLELPLADMGLYQGYFFLSHVADIIIGDPREPDEEITVIVSRATVRTPDEPEAQLMVVNEGALEGVRANRSIDYIEYGGYGHVALSDPNKKALKILADGSFGEVAIRKLSTVAIQAVVSILGDGSVEIRDKWKRGTWVRANWSGASRESYGEPVAHAESNREDWAPVYRIR